MNAHDLNQRVRFEAPGAPDPEYGTPGAAWVLVAELWAKVEDVKPSKTDATKQGLRLAHDSATVWIRHREGIDSAMRIVELSGARRTFTITGGPASITGKRFLEMTVEKFSS